MKTEIKEQFIQIVLALEPERLYQDGEVSHEEAAKEQKRLMKEWSKLEKAHGQAVSLESMEEAAWNR